MSSDEYENDSLKRRLGRRLRCALNKLSARFKSRDAIFRDIHRDNSWGDPESLSGAGSNLENTTELRRQLYALLTKQSVQTILDAPCGDFNWMCALDFNFESYFGIDVVPELTKQNEQKYGNTHRTFLTRDIASDSLPRADLILCRDCLVHLPFSDALAAIRNFKATGARLLLSTTFPGRTSNSDVRVGGWRPLNLCLAPFNFPAPLEVLNEKYDGEGGLYRDKSLGLWNLADLLD